MAKQDTPTPSPAPTPAPTPAPSPAPKSGAKTRDYVVLSPVDDGTRHEIDETITLTDELAAPLLARGAIRKA